MEHANYQKEQIEQASTEMLALSLSQFEKAIEAFLKSDSDLAEEVIYKESRVNALDLKLDRDCERYIALFNPVAVDLRYILTIVRVNTELERIADHAFALAKYVVDGELVIPDSLAKNLKLEKMSVTVSEMFDYIYDVFETENVKSARKVFKLDKTLDKINSNAFLILEEAIKKDPELVTVGLILLSVIKKTERVGDLVKNIAEEVIFYLEAEVLKHRKKKK